MDKPQITQAMINAYDEYTHLTLDRRRFMERLTALAGSGAAAAAIVPLLAANSASAEIIASDDQRLAAKDVLGDGSKQSIELGSVVAFAAHAALPFSRFTSVPIS